MILASAIDSSSIRFIGVVGAAFADLDDLDGFKAERTAGLGRALGVTFGEFGFRAFFQTADGGDDDAHNLELTTYSTHSRASGNERIAAHALHIFSMV